jgi:precorrin-3B synthase
MSSFVVQGWCPGALRPMLSGDGLVVRIRPRMARLSPRQAHGIATASLRHGNGLIDLSARANVQLRGIRPEAHLALLDDLAALDLLDPTEAEERHRNLVVSPFWSGAGWRPLAEAVTRLLTAPEFATLPAKFGVALDLERPTVLQSVSADVRVEWHPVGLLVRPDGFATGAAVTGAVEAVQSIRRLMEWFLQHGVTAGRGRMAALSGQTPPPGFSTPMLTGPQGPQQPGPHDLGFLVGFEFGQMRAETLATMADKPLRITPWRMILIEGATAAPVLADLITAPADPRLRVTACTGAPGCPQGLQPTRDLARSLAPQVPPGQHLHVSGCAKGCAHPAPAEVTLTGTGRGFDIIRNGKASDPALGPFTPSLQLFKAI